jgi:hypothetical protein
MKNIVVLFLSKGLFSLIRASSVVAILWFLVIIGDHLGNPPVIWSEIFVSGIGQLWFGLWGLLFTNHLDNYEKVKAEINKLIINNKG